MYSGEQITSLNKDFFGGGGGIRSGMFDCKRSHWACLNPFLDLDSYTYLLYVYLFQSNNDNAKTPLTSDDAGPRQRCV